MKNVFKRAPFGNPFLIVLLTIFLVYGCGGGGGGGGAAGGGGGVAPVGVVYTGLTTPATITQANAVTLIEQAYSGAIIGGAMALGAVKEAESGPARPLLLKLALTMKEVVRQIDRHNLTDTLAVGAIVTETRTLIGPCGGEAFLTLQWDSITGNLSGNINYIGYCSMGQVVNGALTFTGKQLAGAPRPLDVTMTFDNLKLTMDGNSVTMAGKITFEYPPGAPSKIVMNISLRDDAPPVKVYRVTDYTMSITHGVGHNLVNITGRFYNPDYGHVVISTPTAFIYNDGQFTPAAGVMVITGNNNSKARMRVTSVTHYAVYADADGDGVYEWTSPQEIGWGDDAGGGGAPAGVVYTGLTTPATINQANAVALIEQAYSVLEIGGAMALGAVKDTESGPARPLLLKLALAMEEVVRQIDRHSLTDTLVVGTIVTQTGTVPGPCGGNFSFTFQVNQTTGASSGTINYNGYCSMNLVLNGAVTFTGDYNFTTNRHNHYTQSFHDLKLTMDGNSVTMAGSITFLFPNANSSSTVMQMRLRDDATGKVYRVTDYTTVIIRGAGHNLVTFSGRFYNPDLGHVVLSTPTAFIYNDGQFTPAAGVMVITGNNNSKARMRVNSVTNYFVDLDAGGDGVYEWTSPLRNW